jgi:hypothetical protein
MPKMMMKTVEKTKITERKFYELLRAHRGWVEDDGLRFPTVECKHQFMNDLEKVDVVEGH